MSIGSSEQDHSELEAEAAAEPPERGGVNAVEVAGALLRALADTAGPSRLADLARATGMPSAKAHRYMVSLIRAGLIEQDPASSRYDRGGWPNSDRAISGGSA